MGVLCYTSGQVVLDLKKINYLLIFVSIGLKLQLLIKTEVNAPDDSAFLAGLDGPDQINLLGHWMDQDRGFSSVADTVHLNALTQIASNILADSPLAAQIDAGANFALLTILRENGRWDQNRNLK